MKKNNYFKARMKEINLKKILLYLIPLLIIGYFVGYLLVIIILICIFIFKYFENKNKKKRKKKNAI